MIFSGLYSFIVIAYLLYLIYSVATILICFKREGGRCRSLFSETMLVITEVVFTIIAPVIGFIRFDEFGADIPFAKQHVLSVIIITISSSAFFWVSRITMRTPNPLIRIIISAGLLQGILFCFIATVHFLAFIPLGIIYPFYGFELLSPFIALLLLIKQFYFYNKGSFDYSELLPYRHELGFVPFPVKIMESPALKRFVVYAALVIPMVIAQALFAYGCGQNIDSLVKAFTQSHGFIFSM